MFQRSQLERSASHMPQSELVPRRAYRLLRRACVLVLSINVGLRDQHAVGSCSAA